MNDSPTAAETRLIEVLTCHSPLAIAISGGVDSLTLATVAHRRLAMPPLMVHALSPAVPLAATERVRELAAREGWDLREITAGEFADPDYRANPYNRCYFCKSNLYRAIARITERRIASGANLDDLSDYRPGLQAASEQHVVHPFVEARIDKATIRQIARTHCLEYAELPAQPCLASRVETGLPIRVHDLSFIDDCEGELRQTLGELSTVRVRIRNLGVSIELGEMPDPATAPVLEEKARHLCRKAGYRFIGITAYRQGSAFVSDKPA